MLYSTIPLASAFHKFMSHSLLFKRYLDGDPAPYSLDRLRTILLNHGARIDAPRDAGDGLMASLVMFPSHDDGDMIAGDESDIYFDVDGVTEFAIGRPGDGERLKRLAFDLLQGLPICTFADFGGDIVTVHMDAAQLPPTLLEACEGGVSVIQAFSDFW